MEKIGVTFQAIHRGQRSKKVIFGKIHHFLCIFLLLRRSKCIRTGVWYYYVNDLSSDNRLEKIRTFFGQHMEVKGQKRAFWGKISHFLCDFLLLKQQNLHKNWCILLLFQPSVMYGPLTKIPNNLWDGMQRSKVKRNHFWWSLPFFIVILVF